MMDPESNRVTAVFEVTKDGRLHWSRVIGANQPTARRLLTDVVVRRMLSGSFNNKLESPDFKPARYELTVTDRYSCNPEVTHDFESDRHMEVALLAALAHMNKENA